MAGKAKAPTIHRETARHHRAFEEWYDADRSVRSILEKVRVSEAILHLWKDWFNWHARADKRDAEAQRIADKRSIQDQAKRIENQRKAGSLLRAKGVQRFNDTETVIGSDRDAIAAIKTGIEIERQADGLPAWIGRILNADDAELAELELAIANRIEEGALGSEAEESDEPGSTATAV